MEKLLSYFAKLQIAKLTLYEFNKLGEANYIILKMQGFKKTDFFENNLKKLPIEVVFPDMSLIKNSFRI